MRNILLLNLLLCLSIGAAETALNPLQNFDDFVRERRARRQAQERLDKKDYKPAAEIYEKLADESREKARRQAEEAKQRREEEAERKRQEAEEAVRRRLGEKPPKGQPGADKPALPPQQQPKPQPQPQAKPAPQPPQPPKPAPPRVEPAPEATVSPAEAARNYMAAAECYMAGGKASRARKIYDMLQKDYLYYIPLPVLLEKLRELAQCYAEGRGTVLGLKDTLASIEIYHQIVALQPDVKQSLDDRLVLGAKLEKEGQNEEAVNVYQEIIRLAPKEPDARLALARLLHKMSGKSDGDGQLSRAAVREARSFLELASKRDPRRPEADKIVHECREREAERLVERATFYLNKYHYRPEVARRYLYDVCREYPETHGALKAAVILEEKFQEKAGAALPPPPKP